MKVIKKGKKIVGTMRVTCKTCEAELEITANDLKVTKSDSPIELNTYDYTCPCCHRITHLFYRNLSEEIIFDLEI